ncbi:MAG: alpha/beta hydrolase fold domain-containing protein [Ignavibacteriae bacterium]|nr:alpha/beta hydrolase fold domain-containing protein [Ignavibacteriota bacterium]
MLRHVKLKNKNGDLISADLRFQEKVNNKIPALIFCHGFKGFKDWGSFPYMLDKISNENIFTVSFNFSLNGLDNSLDNPIDFTRLDLFAKNTFSRELDDLDSLLNFLFENKNSFNLDPDNITLAGHSRGGGIAILKTAEDKRIKRLIALASVSEFNRYTNERKKRWKEDGYLEVLNTRTKQLMRMNYTLIEDLEKNYDRLNIQKALKKILIPILFIHGKQDLAVDYSDAETLYELSDKSKSRLILYENTGHTFGAEHPFKGTNEYLEKVISDIIDWVKRC